MRATAWPLGVALIWASSDVLSSSINFRAPARLLTSAIRLHMNIIFINNNSCGAFFVLGQFQWRCTVGTALDSFLINDLSPHK